MQYKVSEYQKLQEQIEALQAKQQIVKNEAKEETRAEIAKLLEKSGFSFDELYDCKGKVSKKRAPAVPKFRNPDDPAKTWSGRGRKPRWLQERLENGEELEKFAI